MMKEQSQMIVIFGSTGDLAKRKLIPALYRLIERGQLTSHSPIVCLGRNDFTQAQFINSLQLDAFIGEGKSAVLAELNRAINYCFFDLAGGTPADLQKILRDIRDKYDCSGNLLFYLALPTTMFSSVATLLKPFIADDGWTRVVFEKPFGEDLVSATRLNEDISAVFDEEQIYRVDHYLGKELVQNILYLRFANEIFSCGWNNGAIDHVQITVSESLGVEERASYYDKSGAVRDMLQNHLLQLLSFIAMEPPLSGHGNAIRNEAAKVMGCLRLPQPGDVVLGQYDQGGAETQEYLGYLQEEGVPADSTTETYVALRAYIDTKRWQGVPFYLRTGKRLEKRYAEIKIVFKHHSLNGLVGDDEANMLIIRIQPDEGIALAFNVRKPGESYHAESVLMDFCHHCHFGPNTPEAYEAIMSSVIEGDPLLFTRWDWLQQSWQFIDQLKAVASPPVLYRAGSAGPVEADKLLQGDGREWL